jgi:Raf kinase inhibitor-like YbhB/YbcL family protein
VTVRSAAFRDGAAIPARFTCDGPGTSPPLAWSGGPKDVRSWALVVDDPDAPDGTFVHWVVGGIPPATRSVGAGQVPAGGRQAKNSAGRVGYTPPCPPSGTHHYRFTVYALPARTKLATGASTDDALHAVRSAAVGHGTLVGIYAHRS